MAFKLISVDDVRALAKGDFASDFDHLFGDILIPAIGKTFASYCNRPDFDKASRSEIFSPRLWQSVITLSSPPIATAPAAQIWQSTATPRVYGADELLTNGEDVFIHEAIGQIERGNGNYFPSGPLTVKVTYTGGYLSGDAQGVPADLRFAALSQAKIFFDRREDYGMTGRSLEGGSVSLQAILTLPRQITLLLDQYKVYRLAA